MEELLENHRRTIGRDGRRDHRRIGELGENPVFASLKIAEMDIGDAGAAIEIVEMAAVRMPDRLADFVFFAHHRLKCLFLGVVKPDLRRLAAMIALAITLDPFPGEKDFCAIPRDRSGSGIVVKDQFFLAGSIQAHLGEPER